MGHLPLNSEFKATYDSVSKKKNWKKETGVTLMFSGGNEFPRRQSQTSLQAKGLLESVRVMESEVTASAIPRRAQGILLKLLRNA